MFGPQTAAADAVHLMKYREHGEDFREAMNRVAFGLRDSDEHYRVLRDILLKQCFVPAGRIQNAIGASRETTPYNCFVSGTIADSYVEGLGSIMDRAKEAAATMRMGGGIGYDFSTLRPRGAEIGKLGSHSSGPISFMDIFNSVCLATASSGHRRGAQMGVLRVDHPDVEEFVRAKQNNDKLTGFNISLAVTDEFMRCVLEEKPFNLRFAGRVIRQIDACALWEKIMRSTWDWAEPGVLFIDRMNEMNNLHYCEVLAATNPCVVGETLIAVAGRGSVSIAQLASEKTDVPVFAANPKSGEIVVRMGRRPRLTGKQQAIVKIILDDGSSIRCTSDHKFPLRDGRKVKAVDLAPGDSLFRFDTSQTKQGLQIGLGVERRLEYHLIAEAKYGRRFEFGRYSGEYNVHHVDENHFNNALAFRERHLEGLRQSGTNHKVISVKPDGLADVYNMTVDEFHNYAVVNSSGRSSHKNLTTSGVFVQNCGEQPLPPFGACLLGSFNLVKYLLVSDDGWSFDFKQLSSDIPVVVRAMDNVVDRARYPLAEQKAEALAKRRMGLGVMGLANTIEALGHPYGSKEFIDFEATILQLLRDETYMASSQLAREKGSFTLFDSARYCSGKFIKTLDPTVQESIAKHGIRNSHLGSIAPTGTISLSADNVSSGIEPVFAYETTRPINTLQGAQIFKIEDYGSKFLNTKGKLTRDVTADEHVNVLTCAQTYIDSSVSKTINMTGEMPWEDFKNIYRRAWEGGAKGCTTFNKDGKRMALLTESKEEALVCAIDAETGQRDCT